MTEEPFFVDTNYRCFFRKCSHFVIGGIGSAGLLCRVLFHCTHKEQIELLRVCDEDIPARIALSPRFVYDDPIAQG